MPGGEEVYFDDEDSAFTKFDIIKYELQNKTHLKHVQVGQIYLNRTHGLQIRINDSDIKFNKVNASVCQNECSPGFRKAPVEGIHKCCFKCVPCSEGEISNSTGQENCWKCPDDHWSDMNKVQCVPRSIEFLSYQDPLGAALTLLALFFTALTDTVLWIFITHRHTAIVKANNLTLSYTLLISLMLYFLSSLLFIGRPVNTTCRLRQAAFGIIFTVAVSSILAKTITAVFAFNALKPNSTLRKWLVNRIPVCLVPLCTLGVVLICIVWWMHSPPFQDSDTHTDHNKLILQCNEGSVTLFYAMVSYFGFLAFFSFVVAFIARKLPDAFNEAQYITFSMLVFCSVWVTFIPAYLSTKGKYMVAVEVFTILASGAGLLGCIFIPKCYIILIRPDLNSRVCLTN